MNCKFCKEEIKKDAKICFHCGKYQKHTFNIFTAANALAGILLVVTILQTYHSWKEDERATKAAQDALIALEKAENISKRLEEKDLILREVLKAQYEIQVLNNNVTLGTEYSDQYQDEIIYCNQRFKELLEPDTSKRRSWIRSIQLKLNKK